MYVYRGNQLVWAVEVSSYLVLWTRSYVHGHMPMAREVRHWGEQTTDLLLLLLDVYIVQLLFDICVYV